MRSDQDARTLFSIKIEEIRLRHFVVDRYEGRELSIFDAVNTDDLMAELFAVMTDRQFRNILSERNTRVILSPARSPFVRGISAAPATVGRVLNGLLDYLRAGPNQSFQTDQAELPLADDAPKRMAKILREVVPDQKISPFQFKVNDGVLQIDISQTHRANLSSESSDFARAALTESGDDLIEILSGSNCDRRLVEQISRLNNDIRDNINPIKIGMAGYKCAQLRRGFEEELPTTVNSMLKAYLNAVDMYAMQFSSWADFVSNAVSSGLDEADVGTLKSLITDVEQKLNNCPDMADPAVPESLRWLGSLIRNPVATSKRALFAVVRSLENLVSSAFNYISQIISGSFEDALPALRLQGKRVVIAAFITIAVYAGSGMAGFAEKVPGLEWVQHAVAAARAYSAIAAP